MTRIQSEWLRSRVTPGAALALLVVLGAGLAGCGGARQAGADPGATSTAAHPSVDAPQAAAAPVSAQTQAPAAASLQAAVAAMHDPTCDTRDGVTQCRADGFLVTLRAGHCSTDGAYGTVGDGYLLTLPDGEEAEPRVELKGFHFACSVATAIRDTPEGAGGSSWEYVVLPPTETVKACQHDPKACHTKPGATVAWQAPKSGQACALTPTGDYTGDCPSGWISTDDFGDWGYSR